jgi:hypothetical protein
MKQIITFALVLAPFIQKALAQDCEQIVSNCELLLEKNTDGGVFISDGQVYSAFLNREKAEFKTTFFGGSTYRIAASAGSDENYVIYTVKDMEGHILFSNRNYKNAPYWDFKVEETLEVSIETELDLDLKVTGCAVMLIGFKK